MKTFEDICLSFDGQVNAALNNKFPYFVFETGFQMLRLQKNWLQKESKIPLPPKLRKIQSCRMNFPVNLRDMYSSNSDMGFVYTAELNYDSEKMHGKSMYVTSTAFRSQLDLLIDKDYMDYILFEDKKKTEMLFKHPIILKLAKLAFYNMLYSPRASIVYTHMTKTGMREDVLAHVKDFFITSAGKSSPLIVAMTNTFKSEISIDISQSVADNVFISSMEDVLRESGVAYTLETNEVFPEIYYLE